MRKTALVTGATRGIGRAIAATVFQSGFDLLVTARSHDDLSTLSDELKHEVPEGTIHVVAADLSLIEDVKRVAGHCMRLFSTLDLLVNNAGTALSKPIGDYSVEEWNRVMNLNARAPFFLIQELLPALGQSKQAKIINVGSVVSKKGYTHQALYAASKHALYGLTKSLARELHEKGIQTHTVMPGGVETEMIRSMRPDIKENELISPKEVAEVVRFLINMHGNAAIDEISIRRSSKEPWS